MKTVTKKTAQELYNIADRYVNNSFNFIQVEVLNKMCDNMLFEHIDQVEEAEQVEDFLMNYSLVEEFDNYYSENHEADEPRTELTEEEEQEKMLEFVNEEYSSEFESYKDDQMQNNYPMWNTCFEFRHEPSEEEIQAGVKAGFGVIRGVDGFNTLLFASGCGYSFYGAHWIPMIINFGYMVTPEEVEGVKYDMM